MSLSRKERQQQQKEERAGSSSVQAASQNQAPSFEGSKKPWLKFVLIGIGALVALIVILGIGYALTPGPYDKFAKCLSEKGATMYGAMGWCKYTQGQKAMFGKSFKHINYYEHTNYPVDDYGAIKKTPTWIIDGKVYENAQSFEDLSKLTGCPIH
jgi:hypothetical protein